MRRLFLLFLSICILFTACSQSHEPTEASLSLQETAETTGVSQPAETSEATETTATHPSAPSVSYKVNANFDFYSSAPSREEKFTRLSPEPVYDLQPTTNGNQIYPFVGQIQNPGNYRSQYRYGIVDSDGCILVDPVYTAVNPMIDKDTGTTLPLWILKKTEGEIPDTADWLVYVYGTDYYGFAAMDGSFAIPCIYDSIYCNDGRILGFRTGAANNYSTAFDVYDLSGKLLLRSEELSFSHRLSGTAEYYTYGQGLYSVAFENPTDYPERHNYSGYNTYQRYLMNEAGELVAGPFYDIVSLTGGPIAVLNSSGYYVYLDETYTPLPEIYHNCTPFQNGAAAVAVPWDAKNDWGGSFYRLLNQDLQTVLETESYLNPLPDGNFGTAEHVVLEDDSYEDGYIVLNRITVYSPQGEVLRSADLDYDETWKCSFLTSSLIHFYSSDQELSILENIYTGNKISIPDWFPSIEVIGDPSDPILSLEYYDSMEDDYVFLYLTETLEEWKSNCTVYDIPFTSDPGQVNFYGLALTETGSTTVYTKANETYVTYPVQNFSHMELYPNMIAAFSDDSYTCLYTAEGELFFSYSIAIMDD